MAIDIDSSNYHTGTASVQQGSTVVTGTNTSWQLALRAGDMFGTHVGDGIRILSIESNTAMTLAYPWTGASQTDAPYEVQLTLQAIGYQKAVRELLQLLTNGNLEAFSALQGDVDKVPYFTGAGSMALLDLSTIGGGGGGSWNAVVGTLAGRDQFNGEAAGFKVLVIDNGNQRSVVYEKTGAGASDWSQPIPFTGPKGDAGDPNILTIGTVSSGNAPDVTITGSSPNQVLNFVLEKGEKGDTGDVTPAALAAQAAAEAARDAAQSSANSASGSATTATNKATEATTARDFAYQWSSAPEGTTVNDGTNSGYSAYHWSKVAETAAGGGIQSVNGKTGASITLTAADVGAATTAQGAKADSALQTLNAGTNITITGSGTSRTINATSAPQVNSDWNATSGVAQILNKPALGTAAFQNVGAFATAAQGAKADSAVQTVNGKSGTSVTLAKADIGLGNVDNTSDANKPISTATQTALNTKYAYNWIINGDFTINQRSGVKKPANGVYGFDRWRGHANGIEQIIEALPAGKYTLTWSGGGNGSFGGQTKVSPIVATVAGGDTSVVVPATATKVSVVSGDTTGSDPWILCKRTDAIEDILCRRYFQRFGSVRGTGGSPNNAYIGGFWQFPVSMRAYPTIKLDNGSGVANLISTQAGGDAAIAAGGFAASPVSFSVDAILDRNTGMWWVFTMLLDADF